MEQRENNEKKTFSGYKKNPGFWFFLIGCFCVVWLSVDQLRLQIFEPSMVLMAAGIAAIMLAAAWYLLMMAKPKPIHIAGGYLMLILVGLLAWAGSDLFNPVYHTLTDIAWHPDTLKDYAGIYSIRQAPVKSIENLEGSKIGVLEGRNQALSVNIVEEMARKDISVSTKSYANLQQLIRGLRGQAVRTVVLNESDLLLAESFGDLGDVSSELALVYSYSFDTQVHPEFMDLDLYTQPFNVLVAASSDSVDDDTFRSAALMLYCVNPQSRQILQVSIPRNYRIPVLCPEVLACTPGMEDRAGFTSLSTLEATKDSLESLLDMEIQFTVQVDLHSLLSLADELQPITVSNDYAYVSGDYSFDVGDLVMNGSRARRYALDGSAFSADDRLYQDHALKVLEALVEQIRPDEMYKIPPIMQTLSKSCKTNFTYEQLVSLFKMFLTHDFGYTLTKAELTGTDGFEYSPYMTTTTYMMIPGEESLQAVIANIKEVENGQVPVVQEIDPGQSAEGQEEGQEPAADPGVQEETEIQDPAVDPGAVPVEEQVYEEVYEPVYEDPAAADVIYNDPAEMYQ